MGNGKLGGGAGGDEEEQEGQWSVWSLHPILAHAWAVLCWYGQSEEWVKGMD